MSNDRFIHLSFINVSSKLTELLRNFGDSFSPPASQNYPNCLLELDLIPAEAEANVYLLTVWNLDWQMICCA